MKPLLTRHYGVWLCNSPDAFGIGHTFQKAYEAWYQQRIQRTVGEV